jgi:hypothetical protein
MATLKHTPKYNRRVPNTDVVIPRSQFTDFIRYYLDACFEGREVYVLPKYQDEIDRFLW